MFGALVCILPYANLNKIVISAYIRQYKTNAITDKIAQT